MKPAVKINLNPKVSIITPVYNASNFISQMIESVVSQTYKNWEIIFVDDCSSDDSVEIIKSFIKEEPRISLYLLDVNSGSGIARNKAIEKASGRYIAFLDSDDIWSPEKLSTQIEFMLTNSVAFSHTSYGYIDEKGNKIKTTFKVKKKVTYYDLLKRTEISCLTAVYDSLLIGKYYMSEHRKKQDYALWLNILRDGCFSYGINKELAYYRQVKNSSTSKKHRLIIKHVSFLKKTQGFSTIKAMYYTLYWFKNGIIRYLIK